MKKALGLITLLATSAGVFALPAAARDRDDWNRTTYNTGNYAYGNSYYGNAYGSYGNNSYYEYSL